MFPIENKATNIFEYKLNMDNELKKDNDNKTRNGLDFMYGLLGPCHFSVQLLEHVYMDLELEITSVFLEQVHLGLLLKQVHLELLLKHVQLNLEKEMHLIFLPLLMIQG
jgi:hypothetical protein